MAPKAAAAENLNEQPVEEKREKTLEEIVAETVAEQLKKAQEMTWLDVAIMEPVKKFLQPGIKPKIASGFGFAGRGLAGYGLYIYVPKLVSWVSNLIKR